MNQTLSSKILESAEDSLPKRLNYLESLIKGTDEFFFLVLAKEQLHSLLDKYPENSRIRKLLSSVKAKL